MYILFCATTIHTLGDQPQIDTPAARVAFVFFWSWFSSRTHRTTRSSTHTEAARRVHFTQLHTQHLKTICIAHSDSYSSLQRTHIHTQPISCVCVFVCDCVCRASSRIDSQTTRRSHSRINRPTRRNGRTSRSALFLWCTSHTHKHPRRRSEREPLP